MEKFSFENLRIIIYVIHEYLQKEESLSLHIKL